MQEHLVGQSILIIGEDPRQIDFDGPDAPAGMSIEKVMDGLNGSVERLEAEGHFARLLLTKDIDTVEAQVAEALDGMSYDVIVIGAGLRTLPPMAAQFEKLNNILRERAPASRLAFNSQPADSDEAAKRWL